MLSLAGKTHNAQSKIGLHGYSIHVIKLCRKFAQRGPTWHATANRNLPDRGQSFV
jgi:hypothetical protein